MSVNQGRAEPGSRKRQEDNGKDESGADGGVRHVAQKEVVDHQGGEAKQGDEGIAEQEGGIEAGHQDGIVTMGQAEHADNIAQQRR